MKGMRHITRRWDGGKGKKWRGGKVWKCQSAMTKRGSKVVGSGQV